MAENSDIPVKTIGEKQDDMAYVKRSAVRAILYNPNTKQIALIHVAKGNYYKLPGGGVEVEENQSLALSREIMEETGCKASIESKAFFATCVEWRNDLHQTSHCYVAKLEEDTGKPQLTELEYTEGLAHQWVELGSAIQIMEEVEPTSDLGMSIKERDLFFVKEFVFKVV